MSDDTSAKPDPPGPGEAEALRRRKNRESIRLVVLFVVFIGALFAIRWIPFTDQAIFEPFTRFVAWTSHGVIRLLGEETTLEGVDVIGKGVAISIREECNAIPAIFIFFAAVLAFPAPWKKKALGLALGFPAIFAVNTVRVVTLYYAAKYLSRDLFEALHLYVWQALVIIFAIFTWIFWADRVAPAKRPPAADPSLR
jgi:exosortase H (IPTLxxWG-CTERM-specific)